LSERDELVEAITRRILAELQQSAGKDGCCADCSGSCAACCSDKVRQTVEAGASRISYQGDGGKIPSDLARYIDHTLLKPDATAADIDRYCAEARKYGFAAVCFNPVWVKRAAESLRGSNVVVASVVGFPLGAQRAGRCAMERARSTW
jgi:deoxyribose-phosphate aldolase